MASELARLNDKNDKNVYFPFGENAAGLEEQIKRKNFSLCGNDAVALLRTLKPYIGGNLELRAIHDLDILDKHRALIPAPNPKPGRARVLEWAGPPVGNRRPFKWIPLEFENVTLVFPPGTVLEQRPIIQTLKELVNVCESVLEAFAALKASDQGGANGEGDIPPQS
jgi:hypothetical protein